MISLTFNANRNFS